MKRIYQTLIFFGLCQMAFAQSNVQDVYVASGGAFSNPDDYVEITKIDPADYTTESFDIIYTQAVTDLLIYGNKMFVAAMDSLVAYDLETGMRYAAVEVANTNKLSMVNDNLWLSRQEGAAGPPADGIFLKVFNPEDLALVKDVEGISSDAAYVNYGADSIYVTVPGNWASTTGMLAVLDMENYEVQRIVDLGSEAVGIWNINRKGETLWMTCKTPYMGTVGSFISLDPETGMYNILSQDAVFGFGAGIDEANNQCFLLYNNTIASYEFSSQTFSSIAPDPGSADWISYASAAWEKSSQKLWTNYTDYWSFGTCAVYGSDGALLGTADVGISPEAMGFHYENATGIENSELVLNISAMPNPASDLVTIATNEPAEIGVFNSNGLLVNSCFSNGLVSFSVSDFPAGLYLIQAKSGVHSQVQKLIVQ